MTIFDTALHIPAEPRPFVPPRALTRITLPMVAKPGGRFVVALVAAAVVAAACLWLAAVLAGAEGDVSKYGLAAVFVVAALIPAAVTATAMRDATRAVLTVGIDGLDDSRLDDGPIAWGEISAAAIVGATHGIAAVRLTLCAERAPRYNPFRIGGWSAEWGRRRRDRVVALTLLDRRPHDLAHTIVALARRHGAAIAIEGVAAQS